MTGVTALRSSGAAETGAFDIERIRAAFPVLQRTVYDRPLVYLDSAASAHTPIPVVEAMDDVYARYYSNVHRGVHRLSQEATDAYEEARRKLARFIGAASDREVVFVRGATEAINLVAATYGRKHLAAGDEVILSHLEHHANIVPWQLLREDKGIVIKVIPVDDDGSLRMDEYEKLFTPRTKLVAVTQISNAIGTVTPIAEVIRIAHEHGALALVDGCQAVPHMRVDVQALDADFYAFSGHKMYGPTGIGALYGKRELLESMPPYQGGGEMIASVSFEKTTFKAPPDRFEAGTPAIVEAIGLGAAVDFMEEIGLDNIARHDKELLQAALDGLSAIPGARIYGPWKTGGTAALVSFGIEGAHPHDIGTIVDRAGVALRAGHHCAQPVMDRFGVAATARASFGVYNTTDDVNALLEALDTVRAFFG